MTRKKNNDPQTQAESGAAEDNAPALQINPDMFRQAQQAALAAQQKKEAGKFYQIWKFIRHNWIYLDDEISLSPYLMQFTVGVFLVIFILWANLSKVDELARGQGKVIPSSEVKVLQSLEGGIVDEFLVTEGEAVKEGQVLMRLRDIDANSDLGSNQARYLGLKAAIARLKAEAEGALMPEFPKDVMEGAPKNVAGEIDAFRANKLSEDQQIDVLQQQVTQRSQEVSELNNRIHDIQEVIRLSNQEKAMIEPLVERGSAPRVELIQLERAMQERQTELNGLKNALPRTNAAVREAQARITSIRSETKARAQMELSAKIAEIKSLESTLTALEDRKTRTEIKSPVDGVVQDIKVNTIGGVIRSGEDVIQIVPQDDNLVVEAQISPADRAFIYPGQKAVIKITAYDFSIYGGLEATVKNISADSITNERGETFYRVKLVTDANNLEYKGENLKIVPGMVASADIITGEKTIMQFIFKPLVKTLSGAFHER